MDSQYLYVKSKRGLVQVTAEQASAKMQIIRDEAMADGRGSRDTPDLELFDRGGQKIGYVSWNGSVFVGGVRVES